MRCPFGRRDPTRVHPLDFVGFAAAVLAIAAVNVIEKFRSDTPPARR